MIISCGLTRDGHRIDDSSRTAYEASLRILEGSFEEEQSKQSNSFIMAVDKWSRGRRFCTTSSGLWGCVPNGARIGDEIVVLNGGKCPYVLRLSGHGRYSLIGECYTYGFMDGEALENPLYRRKAREFTIK
jgi:hypothetical protein